MLVTDGWRRSATFINGLLEPSALQSIAAQSPKQRSRNQTEIHAKARRRKAYNPLLCDFASLREIQERLHRRI
jgi:hypothetical protein